MSLYEIRKCWLKTFILGQSLKSTFGGAVFFFFYVNVLNDHLTFWYHLSKNKQKKKNPEISLLVWTFLFVCFYQKSRSGHFTVIYCCIKAAIHFTPDFASDSLCSEKTKNHHFIIKENPELTSESLTLQSHTIMARDIKGQRRWGRGTTTNK